MVLQIRRNAALLLTRSAITVAFLGLLMSALHAQNNVATATLVEDTLPLPGAMGWSAFTQADQHNLELSDEQLMKLKAMDAGLEKKYKAMGIEPWMNERFPELNRQRNMAVQDILSPEQYQRWAKPTTPVPTTPPTIIPEVSPVTD